MLTLKLQYRRRIQRFKDLFEPFFVHKLFELLNRDTKKPQTNSAALCR